MKLDLSLADRAVKPGLRVCRGLVSKPFGRAIAVICLCVCLITAFHDNMRGAYAFHGERIELALMDRNDMMHYARSMQSGIAQTPHLLTNLKSEDITLILAKPEMHRFDGPTTVWQYRTQACVLDIYYHAQDRVTDNAAVAHYEIRPRALGQKVDATDCLQGLYDSRATRIAQAFEQIFAFYAYNRDPLEG